MTRRPTIVTLCAGALALPADGPADDAGTDGCPAQRGCTPVADGSIHVGATRVS